MTGPNVTYSSSRALPLSEDETSNYLLVLEPDGAFVPPPALSSDFWQPTNARHATNSINENSFIFSL
jgi:hypothetical protein